jgi:hypothetical protein
LLVLPSSSPSPSLTRLVYVETWECEIWAKDKDKEERGGWGVCSKVGTVTFVKLVNSVRVNRVWPSWTEFDRVCWVSSF